LFSGFLINFPKTDRIKTQHVFRWILEQLLTKIQREQIQLKPSCSVNVILLMVIHPFGQYPHSPRCEHFIMKPTHA